MYRFEAIDNSLVNLLKLIQRSTIIYLEHFKTRNEGIEMTLHHARVNSNNWVF